MFRHIWVVSITLGVGVSQVWGAASGTGSGESGEARTGVLPRGTGEERGQEMAGAQGERSFQPRGGGGGRRRRKRGRRRRKGERLRAVARIEGPPGPDEGEVQRLSEEPGGKREEQEQGLQRGASPSLVGRREGGLLPGWEGLGRVREGSGRILLGSGRVLPAELGRGAGSPGREADLLLLVPEKGSPGLLLGAAEKGGRGNYVRFRLHGGWVGRPVDPTSLLLAEVAAGEHPLQQFRAELYELLRARPDALLDLLDALGGSPWARSVVELSLSPLFRREWGSIHDAIDAFFQAPDPAAGGVSREELEAQLARLIGKYLPAPQQRKFWLLGTDVVPVPRPFARTLGDRGFVHVANPVGGPAPVGIGHQYSVVGVLPEKSQPGDPPWVVPLETRRVLTTEKATTVGAEQVIGLLEDRQQPWAGELCLHVADSNYSKASFLGRVGALRDAVQVVRSAGNRVFYRALPTPVGKAPRGHPTWYGARFDLKDGTTWGTPAEETTTTWTTKRGRTYQVQVQAWTNLLMRGKRGLPMHRYPFTLIRGIVRDAQGQPVYQRPLWLIVLGERRGELSLLEAWEAYRQRFDREHYFRFGKRRLLLASYQTPVGEHEENWLLLVQLAAVQLWLGRDLAEVQLRPWEKSLPVRSGRTPSPSQVQRDWERIIRLIGTRAQEPKPRGKSPGRSPGVSPGRRPRLAVVKKTARKAAITPP